MAKTNNVFTEITRELQREVAALRDRRKPATPFMHEKVKPSTTLRQSDRMTEAQRREVAESLGPEGVLKMIRGGQDAGLRWVVDRHIRIDLDLAQENFSSP